MKKKRKNPWGSAPNPGRELAPCTLFIVFLSPCGRKKN
jgi:hypothetical protein